MSTFTLSRFRFTVELLRDGELPPFKGSCIRGALGHALRESVCDAEGEADCRSCGSPEECVYVRMFKPNRENGMSIPPAYVIDPPPLKKTRFCRGENITFDLTLFGWAADSAGQWIHAANQCGRTHGLGRGRIPFALKKVESVPLRGIPHAIYTAERGMVGNAGMITYDDICNAYGAGGSSHDSLHVRFLTPLKFKSNGRFKGSITEHDFADLLYRRIKALSRFYQQEPLSADSFNGAAENITLENPQMRWVSLERRSANHPDGVNLGGLVGGFSLKNTPADFYCLMKFGEMLHLGKNTVYGCGKYRIERQ